MSLGKAILLAFLLVPLRINSQVWEEITDHVPGLLAQGNIGPIATDGDRLYVLGSKGIFVSPDGGQTFTALNGVVDLAYQLD